MTDFLTKGTLDVQAAVMYDSGKMYDKAFDKYHSALNHLLMALKYSKDDVFKRTLSKKIVEYIDRAEELKQRINPSLKSETDDESCVPVGIPYETDEDDVKTFKPMEFNESLTWDDVAGLDDVKRTLEEAVILPMRMPSLFVGNRKPCTGILLYGPPGTGKTFLAKVLAAQSKSSFFTISSSDVVSKYQGDSERSIRTLFDSARRNTPSVLFIDEIDSLGTKRGAFSETESSRRIKTELMVQLNGVGKNNEGVLVVCTTNTPWDIDTAILRRFPKRIYVPLPDKTARKMVFKLHSMPEFGKDVDYDYLAEITEGFSGSDIAVCVHDALMSPVRRCMRAKYFRKLNGMWVPCKPTSDGAVLKTMDDIKPDELAVEDVCNVDFEFAVMKASKSVDVDLILKYKDWENKYANK